MIDEEVKVKYMGQGYVEDHMFPGEYLLLVNPKTMLRVRLYLDGGIWEQGENGRYERVKEGCLSG